jgi:ABC-type branched-subunit amino acid transport system substrate-binding protein
MEMFQRLAATLLAALCAVGCGTTLQSRNSSGAASAGDQGLAAPATGPAAGAGDGAANTPSPGNAPGTTAGNAPAAATASTLLGNVTGTATAPVAPPTDRKPVEVGAIVEGSDTSLAGSLGLSGLANGNEPAVAAAMFASINKAGGLAGHPIQPVYYTVSASDTRNYSDIEQAACADFTQDHHVVAVLAGHFVGSDDTLLACDQRAGVPTINSEVTYTGDSQTFATYPDYVAPAGLRLDRQVRAYVQGMAAQGFFHSGVNTGLLVVDAAPYRRAVTTVMVPALASIGVHLKDISYFPETTSTSATTAAAAGISSAELHFAGDKVGQVLFLADAGLGALEFMIVANAQHYLPRFALSTTDAPQAQEANSPAAELANATGVGWAPMVDVDVAQEGAATPPAQQRCLKLLDAAGQSTAAQNTALIGLMFCDEAWFVEAAAAASTPGSLTAATLLRGAVSIGTTFPSAVVPATNITADQRDGVSAYRPFAYQPSCRCFRYMGGAVQIGA